MNERFQIMVVEDAEADVFLVREALEHAGLEFELPQKERRTGSRTRPAKSNLRAGSRGDPNLVGFPQGQDASRQAPCHRVLQKTIQTG
jgi:hypothetical protein